MTNSERELSELLINACLDLAKDGRVELALFYASEAVSIANPTLKMDQTYCEAVNLLQGVIPVQMIGKPCIEGERVH